MFCYIGHLLFIIASLLTVLTRAFIVPESVRHQPHQLSHAAFINSFQSRLFMSSTAVKETEVEEQSDKKPVPITLLAGFLGSGKTTALKHILENKEGLRVGVIVNDMASVNIDSKLVKSSSSLNPLEDGSSGIIDEEDTIQLENGCACCSLADELLDSIDNLLKNDRQFDSIIVELSGVADPIAVRDNWKEASRMDIFPATKKAEMAKIITVVDASTFGGDWMSWDMAFERENWVGEGEEHSGERKVPELLAEQVEAADMLMINKADLAGEEQVLTASSLASGLNDKAEVFVSEFGRVPLEKVLPTIGNKRYPDADCEEETHSHSHNDHEFSSNQELVASSEGEYNSDSNECSDPNCTDPNHDHSHSHDHIEHSHSHDHSEPCLDPNCTDESHSHDHDHDHGHSHDHDHESTHVTELGIKSFVYKRTVPFESNRLLGLLSKWPVPIKDTLDVGEILEATREGAAMEDDVEFSPFVGVLRSKGFCWLSPTQWTGFNDDIWRHDTAMYW